MAWRHALRGGTRAPISRRTLISTQEPCPIVRIPLHPQGWPFVAVAVVVNALLFYLLGWWGLLLLPVSLWVIAFFRDPERIAPAGAQRMVSPADGRLLPITQAEPPAELGLAPGLRPRLSIFMNVFNVHVNRSPARGRVVKLAYRPGKFFNASFDKASVHNERMSILLELDGPPDMAGQELVVVQIAGLVARRIYCPLKEGQSLDRGERFGMIRFGSRLDIYLPKGARIVAEPGAFVRAGKTVLAEFPVSG
ncbi:MAG: phosphatidylserine decarboxylase family protein [Alphaproteobacteria bacterium]|nr:phosphatidylserine decarboxylase family protein [Alphaproteobacteria bacterium]